ncbi:HET-domain-containing protein [Stipitochalara longipes BDJ]|nr:HET-domain-containing protein [Stipitochalara longipes BDJ]
MTSNSASNLVTTSRAKELYQYQALDYKRNEIRLLKIHLALQAIRYSEPVKCSLITTSLDEAPTYRALSYTWGTQPAVEDISVDGRRFKVTPNLEDALMQLRDNSVEIIWIDAICINQDNLAERNEQVSKMRTVYERADEVLVWLGSSISEASLAFDLFEELCEYRDSREDVEKILRDESKRKGRQEIISLFRRPYWFRLWVIQEIHSAKDATILCGQRTIDWRKVLASQNILQLYHLNLVTQLALMEPLLHLFNSAIFYAGAKDFELPPGDSSGPPSLHTLLCKFWKQRTSDPRDKIYALVGLSSARNDPEFVIDYSAPTRLVFLDMAKYIIQQSQGLDVICSMIRRGNIYNLPSWAKDWGSLSAILEARRSTFRAAGGSAAIFSLKNSDQVLTVSGIVLNQIRIVGEKENLDSEVDFEASIPILLSWYRLCRSQQIPISILADGFSRAINFDSFHKREFIYSTTLELMGRVLTAIVVLAEELYPEEKIDTQLAALKTKYDIPKNWVKNILIGICVAIQHRRLFISCSNRIGLGPETIGSGEVISILLGCSVPVILRPKDGHYIFLGEAYFHGYMYGKAMDELGEGKFQLESFEIY